MKSQKLKRAFILVLSLSILACGKGNSSSTNATDCPASLAGVYSGSDFCTGASQSFYQTTITAPSSNTITIGNLYGIAVTATVNCANSNITIPLQSSGSFSVSGSGTFTSRRITINWTGSESGHLPISCSTTYTR